MAIAGSGHQSIGVTLIRGQLIEGAVMIRQNSVLCDTAEAAWAKLLTAGECYLLLRGDNLMRLRELFAASVFQQENWLT